MKSLEQIQNTLKAFENRFGLLTNGAQQGSEAWLLTKLGVISASNASKVVAGEKTETRATYMAELVGQVATSVVEEINSKYMQWGHEHEGAARTSYEFAQNVEVTQLPFAFKDETFRIGCSPDGITSAGVPVEIKCPYNTTNFVQFLTAEKIKPDYVWQYQFQLWVLEADKMDFVQYDPRMRVSPLHILTVGRDEEKIKAFEDLVPKFISDMDAMLSKIGLTFGEQWKRLAIAEGAA